MPDGVNWPAIPSFGTTIANLPTDYYKSLENNSNQNLRDAFKGGIPMRPDGTPDYGAMSATLFRQGGAGQVANATSLSNLDLKRQELALGQALAPVVAGGGVPDVQTATQDPSQPRGLRNNNPGNIENGPFAQRQPGYSGVEPKGRFATFKSPEDGTNAAGTLVNSYGNKGINTVQGVIGRWAGGNDPNVPQYVAAVSKQLGVDPNAPLNMQDPQVRQALVSAISKFENGGRGAPANSTTAIPQAQPQQTAQAPQGQQAPPLPQASQPTRGAPPTGGDPEIQTQIARLSAIAANPGVPESTRKAAITRLEALQKQNQPTNEQKNYDLYRRQGGDLPFDAWRQQADTQKPIIANITERLGKAADLAKTASEDIEGSHQLLSQLDARGGIFSGQWANDKLTLSKIGQQLGFDTPVDKIANTEAFSALVGNQVAKLVKSFGSGTSITNQDREYAQKMAAGDITLNEESIRRIIEIREKINREVIKKHNQGVDKFFKTVPGSGGLGENLKVDEPGKYTAPARQNTQAQPQPSAAPGMVPEGGIITNKSTGQKLMNQGGKLVPVT